jgi:hypothetical protein
MMADSNDLDDLSRLSGVSTDTLAETDNYLLWKAVEPDGETSYHVDLDTVTLHFFEEEWQEFIELVQTALGKPGKAKSPPPPRPRRS